MKVLIGPNMFGLERCIDELSPAYPDVEFEFCQERDKVQEAIADADVYMGWMDRDIYLAAKKLKCCLLYTSPSPRDRTRSRMPSSA